MKITKQRLQEIIREEVAAPGLGKDVRFTAVEGKRTDMMMPALSPEDFPDSAGLGDLQSDEKFTGGTPIEKLNTLIRARKELAAMSKEELTAFSKSLDAEQAAELRHLLANPMYAPMEEGATEYSELLRQGYSQATALAMASGSPAKKAEYDKLRKQGYGDSEARRFVYGRSYSAMGQR